MHAFKTWCWSLALFGMLGAAVGAASAQDVRVTIGTSPPTGGDPPGGLCVEVLTAIGEKTDLSFEFIPTSGLTPMLEAVVGSTADVACSGIAPTNERREMGLAFTGPIFTNTEFLYVSAEDTTAYTSLADLDGKRVAGQEGSSFLRALDEAGVEYQTFPNNDEGMAAIAAGKIDAYVTGVQSRYLTDVEKSIPGVRAVETYVPVISQPSALAIRSTETELMGKLQIGLEAIKADGTLDELVGRWTLAPPAF